MADVENEFSLPTYVREWLDHQGYGTPSAARMEEQVEKWMGWYRHDCDWYDSTEYDSDGRAYKVHRISCAPARMVAQEWTSLVLNERTTASTEDEGTNEWLDAWAERTGFWARAQELVERAFALGTGAFGTWVSIGDTPQQSDVRLRCYDARMIVPLSYDDGIASECAFAYRSVLRGKRVDTLLVNTLDAGTGTYHIMPVTWIAGKQQAVDGMLDDLDTGSITPPFGIFRPALTNTYHDSTPFGVSVFDDALGAVQLTDRAFDNQDKDIYLGAQRVFIDDSLISTQLDKEGNKVAMPFGRDQQLFRKIRGDGTGKMIEYYAPKLRSDENRQAMLTALEVLGMRTGLGPDHFALERTGGLKTATEVVSDHGDMFSNLRKHENQLDPALSQALTGMLNIARDKCGFADIAEDFGEVSIDFDDSVITDTAAQRAQDLSDVAAGAMSLVEYRVKWYHESEQEATAAIAGMSGDAGPQAPAVDATEPSGGIE